MKRLILGVLLLCAVPSFSAESVGGQFDSLWYGQIVKVQADAQLWSQSPFGLLGFKQDIDAESLAALLESHSPEQTLASDSAQDSALTIKYLIDLKIHNLSQSVAAGKSSAKTARQLRSAAKDVPWLDEKKRGEIDSNAALALKQHIEAEAKKLGLSPQEAEVKVKAEMTGRSSSWKLALPFKQKLRLAAKVLQERNLGPWVDNSRDPYVGQFLQTRDGQIAHSFVLWQIKGPQYLKSIKDGVERVLPEKFIDVGFRTAQQNAYYQFIFDADGGAKLHTIVLFDPNIDGKVLDQYWNPEFLSRPRNPAAAPLKSFTPGNAIYAYSLLTQWVDYVLSAGK